MTIDRDTNQANALNITFQCCLYNKDVSEIKEQTVTNSFKNDVWWMGR